MTAHRRGRPRIASCGENEPHDKRTCREHRHKQLMVNLYPDHYELLRAEADRQGRSISNLARHAILTMLQVKDSSDGLPARPESWIGNPPAGA